MEDNVTKRAQKAINTKNRIFDTCIRLMSQGQFNSMKVADICKEAGVSVGTFYYSYNSKNDIFVEQYRRSDQYFEDIVKEEMKDGDVIENIRLFFQRYGEHCENAGVDFMRQLYHVDNALFITEGRPMQKILTTLIEQAQASGRMKLDHNPAKIENYLFVSTRGIVYDWCLYKGNYKLTDRILQYLDLLMGNLLT